MIVYNALKSSFDRDVEMNMISDIIFNKWRELGLSGGSDSEYMAWQNSLIFMKNVLDDNDIPGDSTIALANQLIKNTYKTLLTRGQKGFYIYCEDKNLAEYIKKNIKG